MRFLLTCSLPLLVLVAGGCAHQTATTAERSASFAAVAGGGTEAERLAAFIQQRTALLIGGLPADSTMGIRHGSSARGQAMMHGRYATGTATAIHHRGYFLTASHCAEWQPLHLLMAGRDGIRLVPARVVWRGNLSRHEPDLAVLHVAEDLPAWFEWADVVGVNEAVIGAGPEEHQPIVFRLGYFAGATSATDGRESRVPPSMTVLHSAPVRLGDSGGPLLMVDGRLVGINVGDVQEFHLFNLTYKRAGRAQRPDLAWLKQIIDADLALPRRAAKLECPSSRS